jgi:hypothetical protein
MKHLQYAWTRLAWQAFLDRAYLGFHTDGSPVAILLLEDALNRLVMWSL